MTEARPDDTAIETTILDLVAARGAGKTICPSEVARALGGPHPDGWGPLMQPVRRVAVRLAHAGRVAILRKGKPVDPDDFRGIYRLSLPAGASGPGNQSGV
ncbi:DUF3253 domain-containing protein [Methylobacterium sp. J-088]|uniref:DUF3253 domain-containing protein n=1 Tax=Methylobacterium sp. J-088 TaxID=2836664 RepID=UPI001FB9CB72|nr:DUF3253 domain-containing protein [Methylobacterium sp. J-088]MCJ2062580.1 DUF3253 domain-containing protein [Methylobacterium sp. J-088]